MSAELAETTKGLLRLMATAAPRAVTDARIPVRNPAVKGPLDPDGEWLKEKGGTAAIAIAGLPGSDDLTYEIANFIDGVRTVGDIRDAVSAEYRPIDLRAVAEYIDLLAKAGAVRFAPENRR
jgi:hypothetical protein